MNRARGLSYTLLVLPLCLFACRSQVAPGGGDGGMDAPVDRRDAQPFEVYCAPDAMGGGPCAVNHCGQLKPASALPQNQFPQSGADSICNMGRSCVVGSPLASGDGFQLSCVAPTSGALPFGAACSPDPAAGMRCAADSLCVASRDFPGAPFCARLCRNDADCPSDAQGAARCLEYETPALPNGAKALVGMCTPASKISGTPCQRERDCAANQGCVLYGGRTSLRICRVTGGTKSLGEACTGRAECRSGECYDREWHVYGGANRTYCSGGCAVSSDCGADQRCARLVVGNNGTPEDPLDDLVSGYCRTMFPVTASLGCTNDASCVARQDGSDTCDTSHGLCYKAAAVPGSPCTADAHCPLEGSCSKGPRFPNGYCQTFGCGIGAASGVDACPGTGSACAQRGGPDEPIAGCYEGCGAGDPCSRGSEAYECIPAGAASTPICIRAGT